MAVPLFFGVADSLGGSPHQKCLASKKDTAGPAKESYQPGHSSLCIHHLMVYVFHMVMAFDKDQ